MARLDKQMIVLTREGAILEVNEGNRASEGSIPMLTWADWELLQELHKARDNAVSPQCRCNQTEVKPDPEYTDLLSALEATPGLVKVVREAVNTAVRHRYDNVEIPVNGSTTDRLANEVRDAELAVAELQDQIKDWEAKCARLEQVAEDRRIAGVSLNSQVVSLSKSLQHYRNAFFTDQRDSGGTIPCPPAAVQPRGKRP